MQVRSEMGLGSKRQLSLPQTEQEGAGALAEAVPDTKVNTCCLTPHAVYLLPLLGEVWHWYIEASILCHQHLRQDAHDARFTLHAPTGTQVGVIRIGRT